MGVIVKWFRGAWWVFINHKKQRRSKRIGKDKARAEAVAAEIRERLARKDLGLTIQRDASETVAAYGRRWLEHATTLKASTKRFYGDNLDLHIVPALGHVPVAEVTRADVRTLLKACQRKRLGPLTTTGIIRTLSTILSEAVEDGHLQANPALRPGRMRRAMRDPNAPKKKRIDPYTREEAAALVEAAPPAWRVWLLCALRTGMRLGELRALRWGDIDWRGRFISVGRNYVEGSFTVPKSGHARRIDLSAQLRGELRLWRRRLRAEWLAKGEPVPDLVFPNPVGKPWDDSKIRRIVRGIVTKAEVRERASILHVLRHTFGSLLLQQGESLVYVKEQMGHASIQVTVDVYGHLIPGGNRGAVDKLDATGTGGKP
jgi:integrase